MRELTEDDRAEVLALLAEDPLRAVLLRGRIQDRPLDDPGHRGIFFGYFEDDQLAGVALLGHHILIYAEDAAMPFFAQAAVESQAKGHLLLGPQAQVEAPARLGRTIQPPCGSAVLTRADQAARSVSASLLAGRTRAVPRPSIRRALRRRTGHARRRRGMRPAGRRARTALCRATPVWRRAIGG